MDKRTTEAAFIICTNNERYLEECMFYIGKLKVPEDVNISVIPVRDANSMTSGYNKAMHSSDAKYKIYIHQDMFLTNTDFLFDILKCFRENDNLAMLGVAGTEHLKDADAWSSLDIGGCCSIGTFSGLGSVAVRPQVHNPDALYQEVDFIDGMLIATQYDLEWDERIGGFHFYDVSQCERFRMAGYEIAVVRQEKLWSFHDFGPLNLATYRQNQLQFCKLYGYQSGSVDDDTKLYRMCDTIAAAVKERFENRDMEGVRRILDEVDNAIYFQQDLLTSFFLMEIHDVETITGRPVFISNAYPGGVFLSLERKWLELRLKLIRTIFGYETSEHIADMIVAGDYSVSAVQIAALHNIPREDITILEDIGRCFESKITDGRRIWDQSMTVVMDYERTRVPSAEGL